MNSFLAALARDPFDPAPMLIHADWLEERGDTAGAAVLRGLVANGYPSLHALALGSTLVSALRIPDATHADVGPGNGDSFGTRSGAGYGHGDWNSSGDGYEDLGRRASGAGRGHGGGDLDGDGDGYGSADGYYDRLLRGPSADSHWP